MAAAIQRLGQKLGLLDNGWNESEATYRIVGNIKRLSREGVSRINLVGANLWAANLSETKYNKDTTWSDGFNPEGAGAILIE